MTAMDPCIVAEKGIHGLGKRFLTIPGSKNKLMGWMAKHKPLEIQSKINEKMIRKAIDQTKI
jgi:short-subunit dehydrogenase